MLDLAAGKEDIAAFLWLLGFVFFWFCQYIQKEIEKNLRKRRSSFLLGVSKDDEFLAK